MSISSWSYSIWVAGATSVILNPTEFVIEPEYIMDTGLTAYLCRWSNTQTLENGAMDGAFLEIYVVTEIVKSFYNAGRSVDLYHYRDVNKKEIDLLLLQDNITYPIEIKKAKEPNKVEI